MKEKIYYFVQKDENINLIRFQICGVTYPDKNYHIVRTNSNIACIEYVEKGTGVVNIGKSTFYPKGGDAYFLHPGINADYYSDAEAPWKKYFVNITGDLVASLIGGYNLTGQFHFPGLDIKSELCRITELAKRQDRDYTSELILILNEIMFKMYAHVYDTADYSNPAYEMKNFINSKIESGFRIEELCRHVSKSESQIIKIFKKEYGITPHAYLLNKRLELAGNLLRNTNLSVGEISSRLNFADAYYFSNIFKQKMGMSPSAYRKENEKP